jgi:hypothetical protein
MPKIAPESETVSVTVDAAMLVQVAIVVSEMQAVVARIDETVQQLAEKMLGSRKNPSCHECGQEVVIVRSFGRGDVAVCPDHGEVTVREAAAHG